jgi:hypothetical protein
VAATNATADQLHEIVQWADAHSPVGCTIRQVPTNAVEVEIVCRIARTRTTADRPT